MFKVKKSYKVRFFFGEVLVIKSSLSLSLSISVWDYELCANKGVYNPPTNIRTKLLLDVFLSGYLTSISFSLYKSHFLSQRKRLWDGRVKMTNLSFFYRVNFSIQKITLVNCIYHLNFRKRSSGQIWACSLDICLYAYFTHNFFLEHIGEYSDSFLLFSSHEFYFYAS